MKKFSLMLVALALIGVAQLTMACWQGPSRPIIPGLSGLLGGSSGGFNEFWSNNGSAGGGGAGGGAGGGGAGGDVQVDVALPGAVPPTGGSTGADPYSPKGWYTSGKNFGFELLSDLGYNYNEFYLKDGSDNKEIVVHLNQLVGYYDTSVVGSGSKPFFNLNLQGLIGQGGITKVEYLYLWDKYYIYEVEKINGNQITIKLDTEEEVHIETATVAFSASELAKKLNNRNAILISLQKASVGNVVGLFNTNIITEMKVKYPLWNFKNPKFDACLQLLIEKLPESGKFVKKELDFSKCKLTSVGTQLPLTPRAQLGTVTVKSTHYGTAVSRIRFRTGAQNCYYTVPTSETVGDGTVTTAEVPVTEARFVVSDTLGETDTYYAKVTAVSDTDLPIFGRYSINPIGIQPQEQIKCRLVLTADGISSNSADGDYIKVNPPQGESQTITVTAVGRPKR